MDINEFILFERKRGDCYKLLSACFYLPKKEIYLEEKVFGALTSLLNTLCPEAAIFSATMEEEIRKYGNEYLAVEYARLFVGPYELKAPPYGSVYLDGKRRVMGNSTMEVIKFYEETGLVMDEDFKELPDHIAVELEFMSYLVYREIDAWERSKIEKASEGLQKQEIFLEKHLGRWIPDFSNAIIENSDCPFYINLAKCTEVFIKSDRNYISATLNVKR